MQQQANDMRQAQSILQTIGYVPQGGVTNTHGNVNKAVDFGGAKTYNTLKRQVSAPALVDLIRHLKPANRS